MKGLYQKRGWYYFQPPTPKGGERPKAVALKLQDYVQAVIEATRLRDNQDLISAATKNSIREVLPIYYAAKKEDAESTKASREIVLEKFSDFVGNRRVSEITAELVQEWRENLRKVGGGRRGKKNVVMEVGVSEMTIKSYTIILRAFLNWARKKHFLRVDPLADYKRQTCVVATRLHDFLTVPEREILLEAKTLMTVRFILYFGFLAGLRDAEMSAMTLPWLHIAGDWQSGSITVQDTPVTYFDPKTKKERPGIWRPKGRRKRTIPLHPRLLVFLKEYLEWWKLELEKHELTQVANPFLLAPHRRHWPMRVGRRYDAKNALKGLQRRTGVRKLNYHILRHSFATHLASKGVPLAEIAALLGDLISVTEANYAGFSPNRVNPLAVL